MGKHIVFVVRRGALDKASGVRTFAGLMERMFAREGRQGTIVELGSPEEPPCDEQTAKREGEEGFPRRARRSRSEAEEGARRRSGSSTFCEARNFAAAQTCKRSGAGGEGREAVKPDAQALRLIGGYAVTLFREWREAVRRRIELRDSLILVNEFGCETLPIALRLALPGARIVAVAHTHPGQDAAAGHWVRRWVERLCAKAVSDVIFNSEALRREWARKLRVGNVPGRVIYHGLPEPDRSMPDDYPAKPAGMVDFLCVARFVSWKGHRELLQAWALAVRSVGVSECGSADSEERQTAFSEESTSWPASSLRSSSCGAPGLRLILVGDGPERERMQKLAEDLGLTGKVIFLGAREAGALYFNGGDVGVLLSTEPEAFGLVLLEAMSRGKPVVASRTGGIPEVVDDGGSGFLVDPVNARQVADTIRRLASDVALREEMGRKAEERWRAEFLEDRMIDSYRRWFDDVTGAEGIS